ncbi:MULTISPECIES: MliC family protein [unclassified Ruegeria]|uniref:MliC family protein n=1 Tax=unclassified Ruegeria TaxID=2625375 RepID=UPI0014883E40|nr:MULTISPECIES: MliC family protein [unclassified Ruegeria]
MFRIGIFAAAMLASGGSAQAEIDILPVTFTCENNVSLQVTYFNATDGSSAAAMLVDDTLISLKQAPSASGIRYESTGEDGTYILRSKGWDAMVSFLATGDAASEQDILKDCSSR